MHPRRQQCRWPARPVPLALVRQQDVTDGLWVQGIVDVAPLAGIRKGFCTLDASTLRSHAAIACQCAESACPEL